MHMCMYVTTMKPPSNRRVTSSGRGESFASCARRLYRTGGLGVFWEGLLPKVPRA